MRARGEHARVSELVASRMVVSCITPGATHDRLERFLRWARAYPFPALFVETSQVPFAFSILKDCPMLIGVPVGHPSGIIPTELKLRQIDEAVEAGAMEVDVGLNVDQLTSGDFLSVERDVKALCSTFRAAIRLVFVPEIPLLTTDQAVAACEAILSGGGDAICTSWGYGLQTSMDSISLLVDTFRDEMSIEASGGIRTLESAAALLEVGASRVHCGDPEALLGRSR
jgi:deoxyribose-phosphate aldolase